MYHRSGLQGNYTLLGASVISSFFCKCTAALFSFSELSSVRGTTSIVYGSSLAFGAAGTGSDLTWALLTKASPASPHNPNIAL